MTTILATLNSIILSLLSLLHFYWMFGGKWGLTAALPTNTSGKLMLKPDAFACAIVAIGLLGMAIVVSSFAGFSLLKMPVWLKNYGIWAIAVVFLVRALGDFKFVGLMKTIKHTAFAQMDTQFYTPLCLFLGLSLVFIALKS